MDTGWAEHFLQNKRTAWIVGVLTVILFLVTNLPWQLDDYDQAKQAFTSFEMVKEGHWFYQQTPHERVATKPPLVGWTSAVFFALTRSWDVAWRLPSFLAAIAISILLFRVATTAYGAGAGLIALNALGFNLLSPRLATLARTDMPLALAIFLLGLFIWKKIRNRATWNLPDRLSIFAVLTAAMLIKGPIIYAFLLPGILLFQLWGRRRHASHHSAWCGWWPWFASLGIFLLWVMGGVLLVPGFFDQVVVREFVARFGEAVHRPQPLYFYLPHLLHKFAPWSVLMIATAIVDLRSRESKLGALFREMSPETFWLVCWSFGGLIAMSLIPSKRVDRIFPVVPPLCLLLAVQVGRVDRAVPCSMLNFRRRSRDFLSSPAERPIHPTSRSDDLSWHNYGVRGGIYRWSALAVLLSILFTSGYTVAKVVSGYRDHRDALVVFGREVCHEAALRHWRYEAISESDEGMLLYLQKTHFIEPKEAISEWNRDALDALVVPAEKGPRLMSELQNASLSPLRPVERKNQRGKSYVLLTR
jgi:4-amino-4-deoxy-L-arabinose transferase-like glycosyltransferase